MSDQSELSQKFEVLKKCGNGGFSSVYKVKERSDGRIFALKFFDFDYISPTTKEYKDFINEIAILKKINHPNVVKVIEELILDGKPAIKMDYIDGETLDEIIKDRVLPVNEILEIVMQISAALYACHNMQIPPGSVGYHSDTLILRDNAIIHNDIHPKNIIRLKKENDAIETKYILIDFGLSISSRADIRHSHMQHGMAEYKAPEKWDKKEISTRTDIYSFGVLLFKLLTNIVPFPIENYNDARQMIELERFHKEEQPPEIWELRKEALQQKNNMFLNIPDYPFWLELMALKCLAKNSIERFHDGKELNQYYHKGIKGEIKEEPAPVFVPKEEDPKNPGLLIVSDKPLLPKKQKWNSKRLFIGAFIIAVFFTAFYFMDILFSSTQDTIYDYKKITNDFFSSDKSTFTTADVEKLSGYFEFPIEYYTKSFNSKEEFVKFYMDAQKNVESKSLLIDSVVIVSKNTNPTIIRAYGYLKRFRTDNTIKQKDIKDEIYFNNGKIKRIVRIK